MILNKFLLTSKAGQNNLAKCEIDKFTSMKKYVQLLLIECIYQSQKFDKVVPFKDVDWTERYFMKKENWEERKKERKKVSILKKTLFFVADNPDK